MIFALEHLPFKHMCIALLKSQSLEKPLLTVKVKYWIGEFKRLNMLTAYFEKIIKIFKNNYSQTNDELYK